MKIAEFVKNLWTFVTKRAYLATKVTLEDEILRLGIAVMKSREEAGKAWTMYHAAKAKAEEAATLAARIQARFYHEIENISPWREFGQGLIRLVEKERHSYVVAICEPITHTFTEKEIRIERFAVQMSIGMSDNVPPELIANQLGEHLRMAVLKHWQKQSILNR